MLTRVLIFTFMTLWLTACGSSTDGRASGGEGGDQALGGAGGGGAGGAGGDQPLAGAGGGGAGGNDSSAQCFPCEGYWICGGDVTQVNLVPEDEGCLLSGLSGRTFISSDGTITANAVVVGKAQGSGARVHVAHADGSEWLFCAGGGGPCP